MDWIFLAECAAWVACAALVVFFVADIVKTEKQKSKAAKKEDSDNE
ncbi:MAG: hypothetical protein LBM65_05405 [Oscillospiraceae bacterium]|jgi:hypothetical protein|nr:hypothetical protein [Oscillospiraceae bacterium]